jgi:hypothetical protein
MIIHGNEIMEPEELAQLGVVFDEAWAALSATAGEGAPELRTALASILFRLAHLRELGPDQMKATAFRILRAEPVMAPSESQQRSNLANRAASCSASTAIAGPPLGA